MKKILLLIALAVLFFSGCAMLKDYAPKPTVKFKNMRIRDAGLFDATFVFVFEVENPNPIGGKISGATYDLDINGSNFIAGKLDKGISLPASGKADFEVPVEINYLDFFDSMGEFIDKDQIDYEIAGDLKVLAYKIPYKKNGTIDLPQPPDISIKSVRTNNFTIAGGEVIFEVEMKNNTQKSLNLSGISYDIELGGEKFGQGSSRIVKSITGNASSIIEIPLELDIVKFTNGLANVLEDDTPEYKIKGNMEFNVPGGGTKKVPFDKGGSVKID